MSASQSGAARGHRRGHVGVMVLAAGLAGVGVGTSMAADANRSAGLFWGQVVATGEHRTVDVRCTGPVGLVGDEHTKPIVVGSLLTLLGAAATLLVFVRHHRLRRRRH